MLFKTFSSIWSRKDESRPGREVRQKCCFPIIFEQALVTSCRYAEFKKALITLDAV